MNKILRSQWYIVTIRYGYAAVVVVTLQNTHIHTIHEHGITFCHQSNPYITFFSVNQSRKTKFFKNASRFKTYL